MTPLAKAIARQGWLLTEVIYTLIILAAAWLVTKIIDRILRKLFKPVRENGEHLTNYIFQALRLPIIYLVFLVSTYAALHRLPLNNRPYVYLDGILFVLGVIIVLSLVIRSFSAFLRWYRNKIQQEADPHLELEFLPLIDRLTMVLVLLIGVVIVMDHFRIDIKSLLVTLGVGSLAIGLALQDTLANMFGGFTIMLDRPFRIGDFIELTGGESGHVVSIGIRSTVLRTGDNNVLSIPNSLLVKNMITNHSFPDTRVVLKIKLTVERGVVMEEVRRLVLQAVLAVEDLLREPPPEVFFTEFTDNGPALLVLASIKDYRMKLKLLDKINRSIYSALQAANVPLASSARTVYVKSDPSARNL
ncbi:MAG: mechanosensitive ion channel family protein [Acidobacteria bacterium]|nr:mechanosensitive ion channel family protein [Acidobacteriota bacterium]MBI3657250.1 mechanosensitive ion channel family protein [Acidobacteriota bacterium]